MARAQGHDTSGESGERDERGDAMDWRSAGPPLSPPAEEDDDEDEDDGAEAEAEAAARAAAGAEEEAARGAGGRRAAERARPPSMRPTGTSDRAAAVRPALPARQNGCTGTGAVGMGLASSSAGRNTDDRMPPSTLPGEQRRERERGR
jgi:hypothetical protein